jgi:Rps23 Pro-64 3,4-dihydroxylase Tpa1-like proline 4-hydroxylase
MIDSKIIEKFHKDLILNNDPFPHLITNNFLPKEIVKKAEKEFIEFNNLHNAGGYRYGNLKYHFDEFEKMPETIKNLISFFHSKQFVSFLEKKFDLPNITPDWSLWGGGMHSSKTGGNLKVHSDFIFLRKKNTRRVLNLLLYLNSDWKDEWKGNIELWDKKMKKKVKELSPISNNVLIFRTDKNSNHGFPDSIMCPENVTRKSLAIYYYVEEKNFLPIKIKMRKYYTTQWKKRPGTNDPEFMDQDNIWRKIKYKYLPSFIFKKK